MSELKEVKHHKQQDLCLTRPAYRQGRKLTAVKVYTVNSESQHLFVYGVPSINLRNELKTLFSKYGDVLKIHVASEYKTEIFTECYHVQYQRIQSARIAKRLVDNKSFYGGILHVCYAPEFESVQETEDKLKQRNKDVLTRLTGHNGLNGAHGGTKQVTKAVKSSIGPSTSQQSETLPVIYDSNDVALGQNPTVNYYESQKNNSQGGPLDSDSGLKKGKRKVPWHVEYVKHTKKLKMEQIGPQITPKSDTLSKVVVKKPPQEKGIVFRINKTPK